MQLPARRDILTAMVQHAPNQKQQPDARSGVMPRDAGPRLPRRPPAAAEAAGPPRIDSAALLRGGRELVIDHAGGAYRLRLTGNNKLILTK